MTKNAKSMINDLAKYTPKEKIKIYKDGFPKRFFDTTLSNYDENFVAPMFGFKDKMEYYRASKLKGKLHNLKKCPTMFL